MADNMETLATRLREARQKKGLSQTSVSEQLNISRQAISRWETGKAYPDIDNLLLLSKVYEVSIDELLDNEPFISKTASCNEVAEVEEDRKTDEILPGASEEQSKREKRVVEELCYSALLAITCMIPVIGILVPIGLLIYLFLRKKNYKLIMVFAIACLCINIHPTCIFLVGLLGKPGRTGSRSIESCDMRIE